MNDLLIFIPIEYKLSKLDQLTITNSQTINIIEEIKHNQFKQIVSLKVNVTDMHSNYIIGELFRLFSSIQYLIYNSCIDSK